ncbi:MAG: gamma-glutamyltransferase [Myxococcales bacterium]|nr:gamma-glutamyltransferase [Myxococcales bacterium]
MNRFAERFSLTRAPGPWYTPKGMAVQQYYAAPRTTETAQPLGRRENGEGNRTRRDRTHMRHVREAKRGTGLGARLFGLLVIVGAGTRAWGATPAPLRAKQGAVASDHPAASQAGTALLRGGGNAIDAACATALALGVVNPHGSGIGGGGFALVYLAKPKQVHVLDFRERAPARVSPQLFYRDGKPDPALSRQHGLAVAVPGEVKGLADMVARWGKLPFSRCVAPAERLARGVPATPQVAWMVSQVMKDDPMITKVFAFKGKAADVKPGDVLRRPTLGRTLGVLAQQGPRAFYEGPIAEDIVNAVQQAQGVMTLEDLKTYDVTAREPLEVNYRGHRVVTMPPPSSGGIVIATALGILAHVLPDPKRLEAGSSAYLHAVAEALKHGFADRARHLGDTDFVEVPLDKLLSPAYHLQLAKRFKPDGVLAADAYGMPGDDPRAADDGGTAHLSVIDDEGNAVALTTTINLWFGSHIVTDRFGVVLNNEMDDFAIKPGVENAFRLLGTEKNAVAPRKRPLSSMSPTLVFDDRGVRMAVGGAGGPTIISGTLQVLLNVLDFGMDAQAASASPRIHHQWMPGTLVYEPQVPSDVVRNLERRGHTTQSRDHLTKVNVVVRTDAGLEAAAEFRGDGQPSGL